MCKWPIRINKVWQLNAQLLNLKWTNEMNIQSINQSILHSWPLGMGTVLKSGSTIRRSLVKAKHGRIDRTKKAVLQKVLCRECIPMCVHRWDRNKQLSERTAWHREWDYSTLLVNHHRFNWVRQRKAAIYSKRRLHTSINTSRLHTWTVGRPSPLLAALLSKPPSS